MNTSDVGELVEKLSKAIGTPTGDMIQLHDHEVFALVNALTSLSAKLVEVEREADTYKECAEDWRNKAIALQTSKK